MECTSLWTPFFIGRQSLLTNNLKQSINLLTMQRYIFYRNLKRKFDENHNYKLL